jgi:4-diphosphocytidyl-2-C-methyl-D-erythritol kinase
MQAISLHDEVAVEVLDGAGAAGPLVRVEMAPAPDSPDVALSSCGAARALPQDEDNLAHAAAVLALRRWGQADGSRAGERRVRVKIAKRIPMAAGLAGGSADAAAVLLALARLLAPHTPLRGIIREGTEIGADVPFCLSAAARGNPALGFARSEAARAAALCEGIGDELSPTEKVAGAVVLVNPAIEVSTPQVYADWDALSGPAPDGGNDLAPVAIGRYPLINDVLNEVSVLSRADRVFMTGSGPTVVAFYAEESEAARGFSLLKDAYKNRADIGAVIISKLLS